jgi:recombination protein RecT
MALPPTVSLDRFARATSTALLQNPELAKSDEAALFQAVVKCAQDGLLPDGREAALVLYKGKAQYLPMIGGVRKIAAEFGWTIRTHVVYENDQFEVDQGGGRADRTGPAPLGAERGPIVGAYAKSRTHRDGRPRSSR